MPCVYCMLGAPCGIHKDGQARKICRYPPCRTRCDPGRILCAEHDPGERT